MTKLIIGLLATVLLGALVLAAWIFIAFGNPVGRKASIGGDQSLATVKNSGQIRICTDGSRPPWATIDPSTGAATGGEIEIGKLLATELGAKATFVDKASDELIDSLLAQQCSVIVSGMAINDDRLKEINFSTAYFTTGQTLLIRKADEKKIRSLGDMKSKVLEAPADSPSAQFGATMLKGQQIKQLKTCPTPADCYDDLSKGLTDAVVFDEPGNAWYAKSHATSVTLLPKLLTQENYGIGLRNDEQALLSQINDKLSAILQSADFKATLATWYGASQ